jgi:hypothetical protein
MQILCYVTFTFNKGPVNSWFGWGRFGFFIARNLKYVMDCCCFAVAIVKHLNEKLNALVRIIIGLTD